MEFLKKMKSREIIEMSLKTIAAVLVGLVLIFLMEGMIFGIYMNKIEENKASQYVADQCVMYCEEVGDDEYKVYIHNTESNSWHILMTSPSKAEIEADAYLYQGVKWRAPNPFDVSITGVHFIVMGAFIVAILGLYGWRFYKLDREYKAFEKKYKKTGKVFA